MMEKRYEVLRKIPIHHVYGSLGPFPKPVDDLSNEWITAAKGIRTIYDTEHDRGTLDAAKALLSKAHVLCLLGFGFHEENINLLNVVDYARGCKGLVGCSRYGFRTAEWRRATRTFTDVNFAFAEPDCMCLETLRTLPL